MTIAVQAPNSSLTLHEAASIGNVDAFNEQVKQVCDFNVLNHLGQTPLHLAAIAGETTVGAYITECGGDVNIADVLGNTPLHYAAIHNRRLFASMLLWGEADPMAVNNQGNTPLHEASVRGHKQVVYIIVQNGGEASMNVANNEAKTPVDLAKDEETLGAFQDCDPDL